MGSTVSDNEKISENLHLMAHVIDCTKLSNILLLFLWMTATFEVLKDLEQS